MALSWQSVSDQQFLISAGQRDYHTMLSCHTWEYSLRQADKIKTLLVKWRQTIRVCAKSTAFVAAKNTDDLHGLANWRDYQGGHQDTYKSWLGWFFFFKVLKFLLPATSRPHSFGKRPHPQILLGSIVGTKTLVDTPIEWCVIWQILESSTLCWNHRHFQSTLCLFIQSHSHFSVHSRWPGASRTQQRIP